MKSGCVYILTNKHHTVLYTGVTSDPHRRISDHKSGKVPGFASKYNCDKVVYLEECGGMEQAILREKQIKAGSRAKKLRLIEEKNPSWLDLPC